MRRRILVDGDLGGGWDVGCDLLSWVEMGVNETKTGL
jgi:hypothetical protein